MNSLLKFWKIQEVAKKKVKAIYYPANMRLLSMANISFPELHHG